MTLKFDAGKARYSLVPQQALWDVVRVLEFGAAKYGAENWRTVSNARERYYNAVHRHLAAWWGGEALDPETCLPHLAHAVTSLFFMMSIEESHERERPDTEATAGDV